MLRIYHHVRIARVPAHSLSPLSRLSVGPKKFESCATTKPLLPIRLENFRDVVEMKVAVSSRTSAMNMLLSTKSNFVDKSMFIADVLDDTATFVVVITRPRRFGKTMLCFQIR